MKTTLLPASLLTAMLATAALAADEPAAGCKMKKEPAPEPACCCAKMMAKPEAAAKPADLDALVGQLKSAKGDQVLDSLAAVINKLIAERKAALGKAPEAPAHQH